VTGSSLLLLGIDLGTSSLKVVLVDSAGAVRASAARAYPIDTPHPGWAEQDPQTWIDAADECIRACLSEAGVPRGSVAGLGLSGQMHTLVCLDRSGRPVRPAILWADQRSAPQVEQVTNLLGREKLKAWTGNPLAAGFMLASWLWLRAEKPETAGKTCTLLLPKDYLRYRLTGEPGSEPSDASSTLLFDPYHQDWSAEILHALEIDRALLPSLHPSAAVAGGLSAEAASRCELRPGLPVVFGGGDQAMQAVGNGIIAPGQLSATIGTGGQLFAPLAEPVPDPGLRVHLFCHALPRTWHLLAAVLSAGLCLRWLRDQVFGGGDFQAIADAAAQVPAGAEGLFFLPYLAGERTPYMDPNLRGAFLGLGLRHGQAHLARAVMEGVAFSLRQGLDLIGELAAPVERLVASGGGSGHPLWLQLMADIFDRPIWQTRTREAAAVGAALLAGVGAGIYADIPAACKETVRWYPEPVLPDPHRAELYSRKYAEFRRLTPALREWLR